MSEANVAVNNDLVLRYKDTEKMYLFFDFNLKQFLAVFYLAVIFFFYKLNFEDTNNVPLKGFLDLGFNYPHTGL